MTATNLKHLLIVDDELANTLLLQRIFQGICHTSIAMRGADALKMIQQQEFDIVLLDIMMPGLNGMEVLQEIRQRFNQEELPVILISALMDAEAITMGLETGANDYITKPFAVEVVRARVNTQFQLKSLADERKELITQLEQANDMKKRLMQIAAHDLRNPVQNVTLIHSLINEVAGSNPEILELLDVAGNSLKKMLEIIQEFLDLDILQNGDIAVHLQPVSIQDCVIDTVMQYNATAAAKGIRFQIAVNDDYVIADPKRLKQVLSNLVSNAIKYSPRNSSVTIHTQKDQDGVIVNIVDQGKGIPEAEQERLFEPFCKISTEPTEGEASIGLGLWIVKQMMLMQHGDVGLRNVEGSGANFWIKLPEYVVAHPKVEPVYIYA